jgi:hypothetical protein
MEFILRLLLNAAALWVAVKLVSCTVSGSTRWAANIEAGSIRFVDMPVPNPVRVVAPGVLLP